MKIFDCFMYFDENMILDLRLNALNRYVDYFVIVESTFTHKGDKRNLKFDIKKFEKFKKKIIYLVKSDEPHDLNKINNEDDDITKGSKYIFNAAKRENGQRNFISEGLKNADDNDIIMVSDVDEIPNLTNLDLKKTNEKIILFNQIMFYYKLNLKLPNFIWTGTKACKKKYLNSPQWLRNIKDKKFPFFRIDTFFSNNKYIDVKIVKDGGWHFTNIKNAEEIQTKLKSYLHHVEYEIKPLTTQEIENLIKNKKAIYNLHADKRDNKFHEGKKLEKVEMTTLPEYIQYNSKIYKDWLD